MEDDSERYPLWLRLLPVLLLAGLVALLVVVLGRAQRLPEGPVDVVWDRDVCAHCSMHVGDPGFAAQLQTTDGAVLNFDDPGCLFLYQQERAPDVHALYFHHAEEDSWLGADEVGFRPVEESPMGYGLAAVRDEAPGAISLEAARERVLSAVTTGPREAHRP
jgi:hypothetical protein